MAKRKPAPQQPDAKASKSPAISTACVRLAPADPSSTKRLSQQDRTRVHETIERLEGIDHEGNFRPIALAAMLRLYELSTGHLNGEPIAGGEMGSGNAAAAAIALRANVAILDRMMGRPTVKIENSSTGTLDVRVLTAQLAAKAMPETVKFASADPPAKPA
jgi:hypothetical protein